MTKIVLDPSKLPKGKTDWKTLRDKPDSEVVKAARADADAKPLAPMQIERLLPIVDVKALRKKLGMTQLGFCSAFKLSVGTVRDWEQRRFVPEGAAHVLLTVIERDPEAVMQALQTCDKQETTKPRDGTWTNKQSRKPSKPKSRRKPVAA